MQTEFKARDRDTGVPAPPVLREPAVVLKCVSDENDAAASQLPSVDDADWIGIAHRWSFPGSQWLPSRRAAGHYRTKVMVVREVRTVLDLIADLRRVPHTGYRVFGECLGKGTEEYGPAAERRLGWDLERTGAAIVLAPALTKIAGRRVHTQRVAGLALLQFCRPSYGGANRVLKVSFDIVGALVLLILTSSLFVLVAMGTSATSAGPVSFLQQRIVLHGRTFRVVKFRSMVQHAKSLLVDAQQGQDVGNPILIKSKNDSCVTWRGRLLRRRSTDGRPQLIDVIKGDRSLLGPRRPRPAEVDRYDDDAKRRLLVKPGMTGLGQVFVRPDVCWKKTFGLDVYCVENWSIGDLLIC